MLEIRIISGTVNYAKNRNPTNNDVEQGSKAYLALDQDLNTYHYPFSQIAL